MADITRRNLVKTAGAASAALTMGAASAALAKGSAASDASAAADAAGTTYTQVAGSTYSTASWRIAPDPIPADKITDTYEADVCVMGLGHAGGTCAMELVDEGYTVVALEKQDRDSYQTTGHDMGHINSELSKSLGGGDGYDPVEFYNNWMLNCANDANPGLVMKYSQNGSTIDWWYDKAGGADAGVEAKLVFAPADEERPFIQTECGAFKFYCTSVNFDDANSVLNGADAAESANADNHFLFGYAACQLVTDDNGAVTGVIAQNVETEEYIQVNCKAVVLATGGFGGDPEMAADLLPDIVYSLQENDNFNAMGMDRTGDGIKMAYWLGARMEVNPATMDGRASWQNGSPALVPMLAQPQGIHLDYTGRRFYNEFWGPIETRSKPLGARSRKLFYAVFDDKLTDYLQYVTASHGAYNPTKENVQKVRDVLDAAYAVKGTAYYDEDSASTWYAGDTIEECIEALGVDAKVAANIKESVDSWNDCCAAGVDTEFGRDKEFLFPIEQGPFYIEVDADNMMLGTFLVTLGALRTDADQRVLGSDWMPIKGLFASGNTTGGRFGWDYFSPCYGVSVGMAIILGRECGKSVGQYLEGKLV